MLIHDNFLLQKYVNHLLRDSQLADQTTDRPKDLFGESCDKRWSFEKRQNNWEMLIMFVYKRSL